MLRFNVTDSFSKDLDSVVLKDYMKVKYSDSEWRNFKPFVMSRNYEVVADKVKDLPIYCDDVWVCSFPRSGTTLLQEMVWLILHDFNFEKSKAQILDERFPEIEYCESLQKVYNGSRNDLLSSMSRPRTIKTHLPVHMLPDEVWNIKPKLIYISRNPKDVAVSYYYFYKDCCHSSIDFESFMEAFMSDRVLFAPFREHRIDFWNLKEYENILYLTYEDVVRDMDSAIRQVARFLGKTVTGDDVQRLKDHLKFDSMKTNISCNNQTLLKKFNEIMKDNRRVDTFIRKGVVGGYIDEMSPQTIERFDEWMAQNVVSGWN